MDWRSSSAEPKMRGMLSVALVGLGAFPAIAAQVFISADRNPRLSLVAPTAVRAVARTWTENGKSCPSVRSSVTAEAQRDGRARAEWSLTAETAVRLRSCAVAFELRRAYLVGGRIETDAGVVTIPLLKGKSPVRLPQVGSVIVRDADGHRRFSIRLDKPCPLNVEENAAWWGSLTLAFDRGTAFEPGEARSFACVLEAEEPITRIVKGDWSPDEADGWSPVDYTEEVERGSALDFSSLRPANVPAGAFGRVTIRNGHFEFERRPGERVRFWGNNISFWHYPETKEECDRLMSALAAIGYNSLRIHQWDIDMPWNGDRAEGLRRFDQLVASAIEHGLYLTTDLYVNRPKPDSRGYKVRLAFDERAQDDLKAFAREVYGRVNPLLGQPLVTHPALVSVNLVNEGTLSELDIVSSDAADLVAERWKRFLLEGGVERKGISQALPRKDVPGDERTRRAWSAFLAETEGAFFARMHRFVREELRSPVLLTDMNFGKIDRACDDVRNQWFDYVDTHAYVDHPDYSIGSRCGRKAVISRPQDMNPLLAFAGLTQAPRLKGKPYVVTEVTWCSPNSCRAAAGVALAASAARDEMDGIWRFEWGTWRAPTGKGRPIIPFDLSSDLTALSGERAAAVMAFDGRDRFVSGPTFDSRRGSFACATERAAAVFLERGQVAAGPLSVKIDKVPSLVWAVARDGKSFARTRRMVGGFVTEVENAGLRCDTPSREVVIEYGSARHLIRKGRAEVSLAVAPGRWRVFALDARGRRRSVEESHVERGTLRFAVGEQTVFFEVDGLNAEGES